MNRWRAVRSVGARAALAATLIVSAQPVLALSFSCNSPNIQQSFTTSAPPGMTSGAIQSFAVPSSQVTIYAAGAQGGVGDNGGGAGAEVAATFPITAGQTLCVVVGVQGGSFQNGAGGGGGGSFVYAITSGTCASNLAQVRTDIAPNLLIAAAGGGGSGTGDAGLGGNAPTGAGPAGAAAGGTGGDSGAAGGTGGTGGGAVVNSGGGGGLSTNGATANGVPGGFALINGAGGGPSGSFANGGFGGGGAAAATGGGGGGYNGGGAGGTSVLIGGGAGGGSFSAAAPLSPYTQSGVQTGNGAVNFCFAPGTPTKTFVSSSFNPSTFGQSVTFTAVVTGRGGTPDGTVTFMDGATALGTGTLASSIATFTTAALAVGSHSITAVYGGHGTFAGSTSALTQTVRSAR